MAERKFFENEALLDTLVAAKSEIRLDFELDQLLAKINQNDADILNDAILEVLEESDFASDVDSLLTNPPPGQQQGFGLRVRRKVKEGQIEKVTFFRVRESLKTGALSLVGLSAALWMQSPTIVISGASLLLTGWRNLITLKASKNKHEIAAYEALLKVQIKKMQDTDLKYYWPSTKEVHVETGNNSRQDTIIGLANLLDLRLVEVKHWGNRPHDNTNLKNLWCQTF